MTLTAMTTRSSRVLHLASIRLSMIAIFLTMGGPVVCGQTSDASQKNASEQSPADRIDSLFARFAKPDSPGCAVAVVKDGQTVFKRGYGMANLEYDIPITPSTVFHIASVSKQFTAMSLALLAAQGKLSLDDDIRKYVSEIPDYGSPITIRHLIHHTSGLRDVIALLQAAGRSEDDAYDFSVGDAVTLTARQKQLNFKPGEEFSYTNTGYTLLAAIVERVSGSSLAKFADEHIFKPLDMVHTRFIDDHTIPVKNRAYSYNPARAGGYQLIVSNNNLVGPGNLWTTVEDLVRWDQNFHSGKVGGAALIKQLLTPGKLNNGDSLDYAFGIFVDEFRGLNRVRHDGGSRSGYRAVLTRYPDKRFSVVCLCNSGAANAPGLADQVASLFLASDFKAEVARVLPNRSEQAPAKDLSQEELNKLAGVYRDPRTEWTRRLYVKDGKLMAAVGSGFALVPIERNRFRVAGPPIELKFETLPNGRLRMYEVLLGMTPAVYEAIQAASPTPEQINSYTGTYFSDEIGVSYSVFRRGGNLVLERRQGDESILSPTFVDGFSDGPFGSIIFQRDKDNRVSGFLLTYFTVRRVLFQRK